MSSPSEIPRPTLHHVNLKTCRMDEMIAWYGIVVGATLVHKFPGGAWLTNDQANHRIALLTSSKLCDDPDKLDHSGIHHFSFEHKSYDDLFAAYLRLASLGIEPHMCLDHGMTMSMYFVDPDGNSLELQADNFGNWKKSSAFMFTEDFARDPIGTPFDPCKVADLWKSGVSADELHRRVYSGEFKPDTPVDMRFPVD